MVAVISVGPTQDQIFDQLGTVLDAVLPGVPNVQGEQNRVPEPVQGDYCVMWLINMPRLATNEVIDEIQSLFVASISGTTMTVSSVVSGFPPDPSTAIISGGQVFGPGVSPDTVVTSGSGGVGAYVVSPSQTVAKSTLASGRATLEQSSEVLVQIDVHGPNSYMNANAISTVFRDEKGTDLFTSAAGPATPLHADDPKQVPFINGENAYEYRLIVEARLQVNPTVLVPQEYAQQLDATVHDATAIGT